MSTTSSLVPMVLVRTDNGERAMDLFSTLLEKRIILMSGPVNTAMSDIIIGSLQKLEYDDPEADITMYINSPGGSVSDGLAMLGTMRLLSCDITTIVTGMAASMGSFLATCGGTKGKRFMLPYAEHMCHQPLGGMQGQSDDMVIAANHIVKTREKLEHIYAECTGLSYEEVNTLCNRDNWMDAEEAVRLGFADAILTKEKVSALRNGG